MSVLFNPKPRGETIVRHTETQLGTPQIDADDHLYRSMGTAPRDLLGYTLTRAQNLCVNLYRANPIANRLVKIVVSFLAGDGFSLVAKNDEVQQTIDEFWESERNRLDRHHKWYSRDWLLMGEDVHPVATDEAGYTTLGFIDPTTISKVERDPTNNMLLTTVHVNAPGGGTIPLEIVHTDHDLGSETAGLLVGEVFFTPTERIAASTRGMPYLLPALDWLDAYDQTLWEHTERIKALRAFFWDVEVDGDENEVQKAKAEWGLTPPRSGSVRFRTSAYRVKAESPELGTYEDVKSLTYLLRHIATGGGVAPHWLSEPEDANRSTAQQMDIPVLRGLVDLQNEWRLTVRDWVRYSIDARVRSGRLPAVLPAKNPDGTPGERLPSRELFDVVVPEIETAAVEQAATSIAAVANALVQAEMVGASGPELARHVFRSLLPALGLDPEALPDDDADDRLVVSALDMLSDEETTEQIEEAWSHV